MIGSLSCILSSWFYVHTLGSPPLACQRVMDRIRVYAFHIHAAGTVRPDIFVSKKLGSGIVTIFITEDFTRAPLYNRKYAFYPKEYTANFWSHISQSLFVSMKKHEIRSGIVTRYKGEY